MQNLLSTICLPFLFQVFALCLLYLPHCSHTLELRIFVTFAVETFGFLFAFVFLSYTCWRMEVGHDMKAIKLNDRKLIAVLGFLTQWAKLLSEAHLQSEINSRQRGKMISRGFSRICIICIFVAKQPLHITLMRSNTRRSINRRIEMWGEWEKKTEKYENKIDLETMCKVSVKAANGEGVKRPEQAHVFPSLCGSLTYLSWSPQFACFSYIFCSSRIIIPTDSFLCCTSVQSRVLISLYYTKTICLLWSEEKEENDAP